MNVTETSQRLMKDMTPHEIESALRKAKVPRKANKSYKRTMRGKDKKKGHTDNATAINKNTRPLNSYMAFRSYYSTIFSSVQQKEISGFVTYMWQADPFKAKWTVLAKAYSAIRDVQGKANAPLDQFLAMNAPLVGIIEPHQYLEALGWNFASGADGQIVIRLEEPHYDVDALSTGVSVNSVIQNCYLQGYFTGRLSDVLLTNDEATMTVSRGSVANDAIAGTPTQCNPQAHNEGTVDKNESSKVGQTNASAAEAQDMIDQDDDLQIQKSAELDRSVPARVAATPSISKLETPVEDASAATSDVARLASQSPPAEALFPADFRLPQGEFALEEAFDPLLYSQQPVFDPFAGNQFDAFDWMDGWDKYINPDVWV